MPALLPVPAGATKDEVALGDRIFHGEAAGGTCTGCHGSDAKGSPQAPARQRPLGAERRQPHIDRTGDSQRRAKAA